MAIIREYKTKRECVSLFVDECFNYMDSNLITELSGWYEHWSFLSEFDEEEGNDRDGVDWYDEDAGLMYYTSDSNCYGVPMWTMWFEPNEGSLYDWCEGHLKELCDCGFVLVLHDDEFWGLAVDGCGYSFTDKHFTMLYDAIGITWHK